ncbi:MAG: peptide-methionine (S)-S-oxide reductase MsrA [Candidatus Eremiobacteraeota bacterium]|nr:peptide-methionine (S)-S-oxide reductase MsrA [Candidatus Eremiobacteraeota bacterium]
MKRTLSIALGLLFFAGTLSAGAARPAPSTAHPRGAARVVLAGGCFWGMEGVFESLKGVTNVVSGYAGGSGATAHYEVVSTGLTGHAESVEITYNPSQISYAQLLKVYFLVAHDPTELNRQGPDSGSQYRSAVFYTTADQRRETEAYIRQLTAKHAFAAPIVTQVVPLRSFYVAENYHQHFMERNPSDPYIVYNDKPKVEDLHRKFPQLLKR